MPLSEDAQLTPSAVVQLSSGAQLTRERLTALASKESLRTPVSAPARRVCPRKLAFGELALVEGALDQLRLGGGTDL